MRKMDTTKKAPARAESLLAPVLYCWFQMDKLSLLWDLWKWLRATSHSTGCLASLEDTTAYSSAFNIPSEASATAWNPQHQDLVFFNHGMLVVAPLSMISYSIPQPPKNLPRAHPFQLYLWSHRHHLMLLFFCCDGYIHGVKHVNLFSQGSFDASSCNNNHQDICYIEEEDNMPQLL